MKNTSAVASHQTIQDCDKRVNELMKEPAVLAHCKSLDEQGIKYEVIPLGHNKIP
jgi:hypothetical protein